MANRNVSAGVGNMSWREAVRVTWLTCVTCYCLMMSQLQLKKRDVETSTENVTNAQLAINCTIAKLLKGACKQCSAVGEIILSKHTFL